MNASSGRDATSVTANSEQRAERIGIIASFENESESINTLHVLNRDDETGNEIPDRVSESLFPRTQFDEQPHTHHIHQQNSSHFHISETYCTLFR